MLDIAGGLETLAESAQTLRIPVRRRRVEIPDHRQLWLLRPRRQRPRSGCAAKRGNELSSSDVDCHVTLPWGSCPCNRDKISRFDDGTNNAFALRKPRAAHVSVGSIASIALQTSVRLSPNSRHVRRHSDSSR